MLIITKMIDFHNHILPNVDDGSKSDKMSINMLKEAKRQGITEIVNTVHFQHPKFDMKKITFDIISNKIKKLQDIARDNDIDIKIHNASEVFYQPNLEDLIFNPQATIGNGKYMLIEFPMISFPPNYEQNLFKLNIKGVTPIIAHPERYREIQLDITKLESFYRKEYIIQLDAGSILGDFGIKAKRCAEEIIDKGMFHLIGSDTHNDSSRNFALKRVLDLNNAIINQNMEVIFYSNPKKILKGEGINSLLYYSSEQDNQTFIQRIVSKISRFN